MHFFYGTVTELHIPAENEFTSWAWLRVRIDELFSGFNEHINPGQNLYIRFFGGPFEERDFSPIEELEVGQRYFFRSNYYFVMPEVFWQNTTPSVQTINNPDLKPIDGENLWHIAVLPGESVDFSSPELARVYEEIEFLSYHQRGIFLQTTRDMQGMHIAQDRPSTPVLRLRPGESGRLLTEEDYLNANPVIVISNHLSRMRGISVGDSITVSVPLQQYVNSMFDVVTDAGLFRDFVVRGDHQAEMFEIELEVVGIFIHTASGMQHHSAMYAFVPDSVFPQDIVVSAAENFQDGWHENYLPDMRYSFVIDNPRYEQAFYLNHREEMLLHGYNLMIIGSGHDAGNFWASADPILLMITFNAIAFWIVLFLVLLLVAFLYIRQRRRDFAILRALGCTRTKIFIRMCLSTLVIGLPPILLGSFLAWDFALTEASLTLAELAANIEMTAELPIYWLAVLASVVFILMLIMISFASFAITKRPTLVLLQGEVHKVKTKRNKESQDFDAEVPPVVFAEFIMPKQTHSISARSRLDNGLNWIKRHIIRSPLKSILGVAVALLFALSLGWLQESIKQSGAEIDRLYDTTTVSVEVARSDPTAAISNRYSNDVILFTTIDMIMNSGFVLDAYYESGHFQAFVIASDEEGGFPEDWENK